MHVGRAWRAVVIAAALASLAACGSSSDKAGGRQAKPVTLTLAVHDDDYAFGTFAAAVQRLSGGSLRISPSLNWRASNGPSDIDYERAIVKDVRAGRAQLGIVGVRVWDTLGLRSFQALVAPFLIDNLTLERRALQSPFAPRALASVARRGVVGIALLPGRLRRPLGVTRALVRAPDYRGARIGIRLGGVAAKTFRALGATARGYVGGDLSGFDGAELDPLTVTDNGYDREARALTGNVVFWPKPQTIVMNRAAFERLTPDQRRILAEAGRDAVEPEVARIQHDERLGLSALCAAGFPIATATPSDRAGLRRGMRPVYARLERNPLTKKWIAEITRSRGAGQVGPDVLRCAGRTHKEEGP